jgi:O-methyltransferase involved in polyketide biosynthesis
VGFDPELSTVWILEGLMYYLHDLQAKEVLRSIPEKSRGDAVLLADFMNECSMGLSHEMNSNFQFYSDWLEELSKNTKSDGAAK